MNTGPVGPSRVTKSPIGLLTLFALYACAPAPSKEPEAGTSFREGLSRLCDVDRRAGLDPDADPISIESARYDWALGHVENPDIIELVTLMRVKTDTQRVEMLRTASTEAALTDCALADAIERENQ